MLFLSLVSKLTRYYGYPAIRRNADRSPEAFWFSGEEAAASRSQFVTLKSNRGQHLNGLPYALTEHRASQAAMSCAPHWAMTMNIHVVRAIIRMCQTLAGGSEFERHLRGLEPPSSSWIYRSTCNSRNCFSRCGRRQSQSGRSGLCRSRSTSPASNLPS